MNPKQMNPEVKALWLEALRSGHYDQGVGNLKAGDPDNPAYCCLGVLCELAVSAGVIKPGERREDALNDPAYYFSGQNEFLPAEVMTWANIDSSNGTYEDTNDYYMADQCLTDHNDNGMSFTHLADLIEDHF